MQICKNCVMDQSDPQIIFDESGICNYCLNFDKNIRPIWEASLNDDIDKLESLSKVIKNDGKKNEFDCIIGLSGGLDSSYVAHTAVKKMGLRPLLYHVDAGWNTDKAVSNIERLINGLNLELYTDVVNWEEVKDLQVAFLKSGIPDQDLVQDAAFFSSLYKFARANKIKHVITGSNYSTECCREPEEWGGYIGIDKTLFKDIHKQYGAVKLDTFPLMDIFTYKVIYQKILGMKVHHPLNLVRYVKKEAEEELQNLYGWESFKHKHHESRFTRFYEDYWLPERFGFHKRKAHFSSLIMTGQMKRDDALKRLSRREMSDHFLNEELDYIAGKLELSISEIKDLLKDEKKTFKDYKNKRWFIGMGAKILQVIGAEKRFFR